MTEDAVNFESMLTKKQLDYITRLQIERQREFKKIPKKGIKVRYLGKEFVVLKNVFTPFDDSMPLVENYQINPGEEVLDVCTGSGVIAIFSAYKGAKKVVALDINPEAVKCAKINVKLHGFSHIIDVRLSDVFSAVPSERMKSLMSLQEICLSATNARPILLPLRNGTQILKCTEISSLRSKII